MKPQVLLLTLVSFASFADDTWIPKINYNLNSYGAGVQINTQTEGARPSMNVNCSIYGGCSTYGSSGVNTSGTIDINSIKKEQTDED
jgi:hypothetical protein